MSKTSNKDAKSKKIKNERGRNWSIIVYPESAPSNWREILKEDNLTFIVSPLHNSDINEGTGEIKKEHYHILLIFDGNKSYTQIKEISDKLNSPIPQLVKSMRGAVRYLIHLDNPDKHQYKYSDIEVFGNYDIIPAFQNSTDKYDMIAEMMQHVIENNITEFATLLLSAKLNNEMWFRALCDNCAYVMTQFIKSRRHQSAVNNEKDKILLEQLKAK